MRNIHAKAIMTLAALCLASPALAGGGSLSPSSSGSVGIMVIIPPIAAGLQAQAAGAVGLWTLQSEQSALMISLPAQIGEGAQSPAAIYAGQSNLVSVAIEPNRFVTMTPTTSKVLNGLTRQSFVVSRANRPSTETALNAVPNAVPKAVTVTISAI